MNDEIGPRRASTEIHDSLSPVRETSNGNTSALYEFGPFRLDPTEHKLLRGNQIVALTPKAFDTLHLLVRNSGHLLEKDELIGMLWPETEPEAGRNSEYEDRLVANACKFTSGGEVSVEVSRQGTRPDDGCEFDRLAFAFRRLLEFSRLHDR